MYDDDEKRIAFGKTFSLCNALWTLFSSVALLFISANVDELDNSKLLTSFASVLCSPYFLVLQFAVLFGSILFAKRTSHYRGAFAYPAVEELPVNWSSLQKAPFARRFGVKLRYWTQKLTPLKSLIKYCVALTLSWLLVCYIVICFGAPVLSEHSSTASFVTGLCIQSVWPWILIEGWQLEAFGKLFKAQDLDILAKLLQRNAYGAISGAWFGAFPIPLDWDRPWQAWPLTCILGAYTGSSLLNLFSLVLIHKADKKNQKSSSLIRTNKKKL